MSINPMKNQFKANSICSAVAAVLVLGGLSAQAASETWSATPVDNSWTNVANWSGGAFPGASNTTTTADIATFNSSIPVSGIGGAGDPITNGFDSGIGSILFDTANCGAFVFGHSFSDFPLQVMQNGNITINPTVVNPIVFNEALQFRGPSSQDYVWRITNNAASPLATLYITAVTNLANSTTRPLNINLAGINTGTNTIGQLNCNNGAEGAFCLDVWGGHWIFNAPIGTNWPQKTSAGIPAYVHVNAGTLEAQDPQALGDVTVGNFIVSNSVLQIDGVTLTNSGITVAQHGEILMEGNGTNNQISIPAVSESATLATANFGSIMTLSSVIGGLSSSIVDIAGPGIVLLNGSSTFAGSWAVNSGTFQLGGSTYLPAGGGLTIAAGGQFDVSPLGAVSYTLPFASFMAEGTGGTVGSTAASLNAATGGTIAISSGISLNFAPASSSGDSAHPALYISQGTLSIGGNTFTVNNTSGTPLGSGTYLLVQQAAGNITSGGNYAVTVTGSGLAAGAVGTIQVTGGSVNLIVTIYVPKNLSWQGGNPNDNWDVNTTPNWLSGASSSVFNDSDEVAFNAEGAANPTVNIVGAVAPGSVVVDTTAANYTFSGSGGIAGDTGLAKLSHGTLVLSNPNSYLGMTIISNGTIQAGINGAFSGASDVTISNAALLDLNTYSNNIGALNGGGTVDTVAGGTATLMVGNNSDNGTFNGTIQNSAGTLSLIKGGTGTETLGSSNSYSGTTTINNGTLRAANANALGTSAVTVNAGSLDIATSVDVASIAGNGNVVNNTTTTTNELIVLGASTFNGDIADGSGGGKVSVLVNGGTLEFTAPSTYSGNTYVAGGATLAIGNQSPAAQPGTGTIIASNNAAVTLPGTGSASAALVNSIQTVNNAEASFGAAVTANAFAGQFLGGVTATDVFFGGTMTISGSMSFSNFLGTVVITNGEVRGFNALQGGDNTAFDFIGGGGWFVRDANDTVHFGILNGDETAVISGPSVTPPGIYMIGGANVNSTYSGAISGSNNIIKIGTGTLTLNSGGIFGTNTYTDPNTGFPVTYIGYGSNELSYVGATTISNGVLALDAPAELYSNSIITIAAPSAVLDASQMGYISNLTYTLENGATQEVVADSQFELVPNQTLAGVGTLNGFLIADQGSIFNVGLPTGTFNVTSNASLAGAINMTLNITNAPTNSELVAESYTIGATATLNVTNTGPGLYTGSTFKLFDQPVSGFASVTLPSKDPTGTTNYLWQNNLAVNGSITLTNGGLVIGPAIPPPIKLSLSGNSLTLSWPPPYLGYILQAQTNSLGVGLSSNWFNVTGSASVTNMTMTVDPGNGCVFYRLIQ